MSAELHLELHLRGRVVSAGYPFEDGVVTVSGERITAVRSFTDWKAQRPCSPTPLPVGTLLPGLVDMHNHGGGGHGFDTLDAEEATAAAEYHHALGTTTILASIVSAPADEMVEQVAMLRELAAVGMIGGIHVEGPFLADTRCGAHDRRHLLAPDPRLTSRLLDAAGGHLRVMTLAPELPGFDTVARMLADRGTVVALGHSEADFDAFSKALRPNGFAASVTHLGNGMPPIHHRASGAGAAALTAASRGQIVVELIGDGVHVDAGFGTMVFAVAEDQIALVTDAMRAAGMPDGRYRLGAREMEVGGGVARTEDGFIAGGTSHLLQGVSWAVRECGISLAEAVRAASLTPAIALGLTEVGDLCPGRYADVLVVDDELGLRRVLRRGRWLS
ncbi:amidohydrolase family protein [Nocardia otitidiscaviarum]|uniref:N-acetylglucosamine-6-phosphate deacetylase n=1 Tax=Nocardia otitidiscaviarum TaxID=1823 RepID=UPI0018938672|nr:amidohydrolase family protein [Nocardia otitidiscaviarum]MBF6239845.1 amidohydrolase family protein [Nocardia otitidiscaviarum]